MRNLPQTMLQQMIKVLNDPLVFGLSPYDQATLVQRFCLFMRDQIKNIRLLRRRSVIMKDFCKHVDDKDLYKTEFERNKESLAVDGYYQKFALEHNKWMYCGKNSCEQCSERKIRWDASNDNPRIDIKNSPILSRIILAFDTILESGFYRNKTFSDEMSMSMIDFKDVIEQQFKEIEQQIFFKFQSDN